MSTLSAIFSRASVSEIKDSNWSVVSDTKAKFGAKDLEIISEAIVLTCSGKYGEYKALKVTVPSMKKAFWFTLDARSSKVCSHMEEVDPAKLVIYDLANNATGEVITRVRVLE